MSKSHSHLKYQPGKMNDNKLHNVQDSVGDYSKIAESKGLSSRALPVDEDAIPAAVIEEEGTGIRRGTVNRRSTMGQTTTDRDDTQLKVFTPSEIYRRGFKSSRLLCFHTIRNMDKKHVSKRPKVYEMKEGVIGNGPEAVISLNHENLIDPANSLLRWDSNAAQFTIQDNHSSGGTYIMLSSARGSRDRIKLKLNDVIILGSTIRKKKKFHIQSLSGAKRPDMMASTRASSIQNGGPKIWENQTSSQEYLLKLKVTSLKERRSSLSHGGSASSLLMDTKGLASKSNLIKIDKDHALNKTVGRQVNKPVPGALVLSQEDLATKQPKHATFGEVHYQDGTIEKQVFELHDNLFNGFSNKRLNNNRNSSKSSVDSDKTTGSNTAAWQKQRIIDFKQAESTACMEVMVVAGPSELLNKRFSVTDNEITIGSHQSNTIHVPEDHHEGQHNKDHYHSNISSSHAKILRDEDSFWLQDLSFGNRDGTRLQLVDDRTVVLQQNDILLFGSPIISHTNSLAVSQVSDTPGILERWTEVALEVRKTRKSVRHTKYSNDASPYTKVCALFGHGEEFTIGRRSQDCHLSVKDYEMPAFSALITYFDARFFIESLTESKKKGVFLLIGRSVSNENSTNETHSNEHNELHGLEHKIALPSTAHARKQHRAHHLKQNDIIKIGRSMFKVLEIKTENKKKLQQKKYDILQHLENVSMFKMLDSGELDSLASAMSIVTYEDKELIVEQGEHAGRLYIIKSGQVKVYHSNTPHKILATLESPMYFGEMGLMSGFAAVASVEAVGEVECMVLDYYSAKLLLDQQAQDFVRLVIERRHIEGVVAHLKNVPELSELPDAQLIGLASRMRKRLYNQGDVLHEKGAVQSTILLVIFGSVLVTDYDEETHYESVENEHRGSLDADTKAITTGYLFGRDCFKKGSNGSWLAKENAVAGLYTMCMALDSSVYDEVIHQRSIKDLKKEVNQRNAAMNNMMKTRKASTRLNVSAYDSNDTASSYTLEETDLHNETDMYVPGKSKDAALSSGNKMSRSSSRVAPASITGFKARRSESVERRKSIQISSNDEGEEGSSFKRKRPRASRSRGSLTAEDTIGENEDAATAPEVVSYTALDSDVDSDLSSVGSEEEEIEELEELEEGNMPHYKPWSQQRERMKTLPYYLVLKAVSGPQRKRKWLLDKAITVVGSTFYHQRGSGNNSARVIISLNDRTVSKENTLIEYRNGTFYVTDMNSTHGTFIRINPGAEYRLQAGDTLDASHHEFTILAKTDVELANNQSIECCSIS